MQVVDQNGLRTLYFKNNVVQSSIHLEHPARLVLRYTQYMMTASLLAHQRPLNILLVGLGAGALLHFLHQYLPYTRVDAVDYSADILELARTYFNIPENTNIRIHCADGLSYLATRRQGSPYDLILLDAFNDQGMAGNIYSNEFFRLARLHLQTSGVICCNIWSGNRQVFNRVKKAMINNSTGQVFIPVRKRENIISLLFQTTIPWRRLCPPSHILQHLRTTYDLDFAEVSRAARKHNMKLTEKLQHYLH